MWVGSGMDGVTGGSVARVLWLQIMGTVQGCVGAGRLGVGAWRVQYTEHEFCHLLSGRVRLHDDAGGDAVVLEAGQSFVVPAGFSGVWEVLEPARKLYAIYEPGD